MPLDTPKRGQGDAVLDLIGNTPMVEVTRLDTGPCGLFLKLENQNPGGSIKDRIGLSMIEAAERDGTLEARRHDRRSDRGQHRPGPRARRRAQGLPADARHSRQDEPGEDLPPARHGRGSGADALGRGQGPSRLLPGPGAEASRARRRAPSSSTSSAIPPTRTRTRPRPAPEIWEQMDHKLDAVVCGVGSSAARSPASRASSAGSRRTSTWCWPIPAGSILVDQVKTGKFGEAGSWLVEGIGEDFIPPICDLSRRARGLHASPTPRASPPRASCSRRKASSAARPRARCSPRRCATAARASSPERVVSLVLRQRQQVSVEDVQRLLARRPGLPRTREARRPARLHRPARRGARHRGRRAPTTRCSWPTRASS